MCLNIYDQRDMLFNVHQYFSFAILKSLGFFFFFQEKAVPQTVVGYEFTRLSKMQHNILFFFACLNFELISSKDL